MSGQREFVTERSVTMDQALRMIRAALDDEGLALGPSCGSGDGVTSVLDGDLKTFRVPSSRVVTREEDAGVRAAFAARTREEARP